MAQPRTLFIWKHDFLAKDGADYPAVNPDEVENIKFEPVIKTNLFSVEDTITTVSTKTYNNASILIPNLISRFTIQHATSNTGRTWTLAFNYASGSPSSDTFTFQCSGLTSRLAQFAFFTTRDINDIVLDNTSNSIDLRVYAAFGTAPLVRRETT